MKIKNTFAIGCLVQFYEIEMIPDYIESVKQALKHYSDDELIVDFTFNINQMLEKIDESQISVETLVNKFTDLMDELESYGNYGINYRINEDFIAIADYRRWFNDEYCKKVDVLVWGESDMLVPKQMFTILNNLHQMSLQNNNPKYLSFFGT